MNQTAIGLLGPSTPFSQNIEQAILIAQCRLSRATSVRAADRLERSLDELVRRARTASEPVKIVRAAWGNAGKVTRGRAPLDAIYSDHANAAERERVRVGRPAVEVAEVELRHFLGRAALPEGDRHLLLQSLEGLEAEEIAGGELAAVRRTRVALSRARARAYACWRAAA